MITGGINGYTNPNAARPKDYSKGAQKGVFTAAPPMDDVVAKMRSAKLRLQKLKERAEEGFGHAAATNAGAGSSSGAGGGSGATTRQGRGVEGDPYVLD